MSTPDPTPNDLALTHVGWRKSSYSGGANDCVELAEIGVYVAVRDSKSPEQAPLVFARSEIRALVAAVKAGQFDRLG